jgi:choline-sulfatase
VLSEYHAIGCTGGATLLRHGSFKYCHYVDHPAQLFDLAADPEELQDLATNPAHRETLLACEAALRRVLNPEEVDQRAKQRQQDLLAAHGGRDAALARGDLGFTPAPGTEAAFN